MLQIAIVEDEDLYAEQLSEYMEKFQEEYNQEIRITRFRDGDQIVENYKGNFDIILMDIQMKFMDGMSAAEEIRKMDKDVIIMFITNMTQYAIRGYEVDALDYILKPVSYFSFAQKLDRAIRRLGNRESHTVVLNLTNGIVKIKIEDIYYIESEGHNLVYVTKNGEVRMRAKMQDAEDTLLQYGFFRSHKGYLVNMEYVEGIKDGNCLIHKQELPISRGRKNDFLKALAVYMGDH